MKYLTVDFGSTYTKLSAIDADRGCVVATAAAFTTIDTPTAVILTYTCQTGSYSATEMNRLLEDTAVVNPGPAKMDDGRSSGTSPDQT